MSKVKAGNLKVKLELKKSKGVLRVSEITRLIIEVKFEEIARLALILSKVGKTSTSKI